jgi:hypothetical protein
VEAAADNFAHPHIVHVEGGLLGQYGYASLKYLETDVNK